MVYGARRVVVGDVVVSVVSLHKFVLFLLLYSCVFVFICFLVVFGLVVGVCVCVVLLEVGCM